MKILVTGATSLIGKDVISLLLKDGHEIRTLTRQLSRPAIIKKTEVWTYDLADTPNEIAEGIDTVIHIAAATPGANSSAESYQKTNIDGTKQLLSICEEQNVRRFIFISSIVVLYDEYKDDYTRSKREAEKLISRSNLDWTILRPAEIIGADKSWDRFLQILRKKKIVLVPGNGSQLRHPVFYGDVAKAIIQVINHVNTSGKKYTLAAAKPISYYQYLILVKNLFKCKFTIIRIPFRLIKILSFFKALLPEKLKKKINNAYAMMRNINLDIQNAIDDFGYKPADIEKGLRDLAEETSC
jgi:nucleoside-diphosphate-sugar epimerase